MVAPVVVAAATGALVESMMSLGGSGGFWKKTLGGMAVGGPVGAAVGAVTVAVGGPWWAAILVTAGIVGAVVIGTKILSRRRTY